MVARIRDLGVTKIFAPLIEDVEFADRSLFNKALFFILHCYSKESKKDLIGADWNLVKTNVASDLKFPLHYIDLSLKSMQQTCFNYVEFQGSRIYYHLFVLKEQYNKMLKMSLSGIEIKDKDGNISYDMSENIKYGESADELLERIMKFEAMLNEENKDLKTQIDELEQKSGKRMGSSLSVDTNNLILN